jgi:hypothetical protein
MLGDILNIVQQGGGDLVQVVSVGEAARKAFQLGGNTIDFIKGFVGKTQDENLKNIGQKTAEKMAGIAPERMTAPSPSIITPLIEAACQESQEQLQDIWAALLANTLLDHSKKVQKDMIAAVKKFEPIDAIVLKIVAGMPNPTQADNISRQNNRQYLNSGRQPVSIFSDEWEVSLKRLQKLDCISLWAAQPGDPPSGMPNTTAFGRQLLAACTVA